MDVHAQETCARAWAATQGTETGIKRCELYHWILVKNHWYGQTGKPLPYKNSWLFVMIRENVIFLGILQLDNEKNFCRMQIMYWKSMWRTKVSQRELLDIRSSNRLQCLNFTTNKISKVLFWFHSVHVANNKHLLHGELFMTKLRYFSELAKMLSCGPS